MMNDTPNRVAATLVYYQFFFDTLREMGYEVYPTGSALVTPAEAHDLDVVVEITCSPAEADAVFHAWGFSKAEQKHYGDADTSDPVPPEDAESDHGVWEAPAHGLDILPTQLLVFTRGSVAAGQWKAATNRLLASPQDFLTREARVRLFRSIRGQPIQGA